VLQVKIALQCCCAAVLQLNDINGSTSSSAAVEQTPQLFKEIENILESIDCCVSDILKTL
jgi:hypothetical protein